LNYFKSCKNEISKIPLKTAGLQGFLLKPIAQKSQKGVAAWGFNPSIL